MCLILTRKTKRTPKPRTAKRDIVVYKVVETNFDKSTYFSPYYDFKYKLNKRNKRIKLQPECYRWSNTLYHHAVEQGYHADTKLEEAKNRKSAIDKYGIPFIVCKAIIPKGEQYFVNKDNEIVASNLILVEEVN